MADHLRHLVHHVKLHPVCFKKLQKDRTHCWRHVECLQKQVRWISSSLPSLWPSLLSPREPVWREPSRSRSQRPSEPYQSELQPPPSLQEAAVNRTVLAVGPAVCVGSTQPVCWDVPHQRRKSLRSRRSCCWTAWRCCLRPQACGDETHSSHLCLCSSWVWAFHETNGSALMLIGSWQWQRALTGSY